METNKLAKALIAFRNSIETVKKDAKNPFFKSKYADLPSILEAIKKPLSDNGLALTHGVARSDNWYDVMTKLIHSESGEQETSFFPLFGSKPQEFWSSLTYARRYNIQALLDIPTDDDDWNEANKAPRAKHEQTTPTGDKPTIQTANIKDLAKGIQEGNIPCWDADAAIALAEKKYTVPDYAKEKIREATKDIFL